MATQALRDIGNVILEPTPTFDRMKEKPKTQAWLPLLILIVLSVGIMYWWISTVDFAWLVEHMVSAQPKASPEARAAIGKFMTPTSMLWSGGFGAVVGTLVTFALSALYYLVAGKVIGVPLGFGKWFGFSVWTSVPRLLAVPLSAVQIVTSHGRLAPEDMNMVSLNYLVFHLPASNPWASLATSIDLTTIWCLVLAMIGLKAWTGRSTATCFTVAALPYLIVYGLWAAKVAFFG
jgi:Yip1 domain